MQLLDVIRSSALNQMDVIGSTELTLSHEDYSPSYDIGSDFARCLDMVLSNFFLFVFIITMPSLIELNLPFVFFSLRISRINYFCIPSALPILFNTSIIIRAIARPSLPG